VYDHSKATEADVSMVNQ